MQSIETKRVKRQVPPDTTAIIFWLKNRKPTVWRDRREIDHSGEMKQTVVQKPELSNLSVEELKQIESILTKPADSGGDTKEIARRDYYEYVCYVHEGRYKKAPHSEFVGRVIQEAIDKKKQMNAGEIPTKNQYIAINMPPRHSKSMTITETLPSYYLGNFPEDRVIEISYSDTFARRFGKKNKEKVKQYGADLFDIHISKESSAHDEWLLDNEIGGMISRGVLSGITGMGADLMIIDDPIKNREEADSETHRGKIWDEWIDSFSTRLHPGAIVILILTRWHEDDLQGRLLSEEYGKPLPWQVYNLPLEAEEDDVIGREVGEPLWPERYGLEFIQERKRYPSSFNSLYQGRPTALKGIY